MAARNRESWLVASAEAPTLAAFAEDLTASDGGPALLDAVFGNSPYLSHLILRDPAFLGAVLSQSPDATLAELFAQLRAEAAGLTDIAGLMTALRRTKRRCALLAAIADIAGAWNLDAVTAALSDLAETALSLGAAFLLRQAHERGDLVLPFPDQPERESGLVVLGMGKLGGRELNYSSDIDIIIFYDQDKVDYRGRKSVGELFVRIARDLVRIMDERTCAPTPAPPRRRFH
jgi:glutamate-ammonia-ligase adenylyltransferase